MLRIGITKPQFWSFVIYGISLKSLFESSSVLKEVIVSGSRYVGNALSSFGTRTAVGALGTTIGTTVGLVLLPLDEGRGSEMNRPFVIPPYLLPKEDNDKSFIDKYTPAPKELKGFPDSKRVPNKGRARWKNKDGRILE